MDDALRRFYDVLSGLYRELRPGGQTIAACLLAALTAGCDSPTPEAVHAHAHSTGAAPVPVSPHLEGSRTPTVHAIPGKPRLVGPADEEEVRNAMRAQGRRPFKSCYEKALQSQPELHGKVVFSYTINPDGTVASPTISESSLNHAEAEACMLEQLLEVKFPPVQQAVTAHYPFTFELDEHVH